MAVNAEAVPSRWRIWVGLALFILSIGWPLLLPVLPMFGVSGTRIAAITAAMLIVGELLLLAAVAVMGKTGFTLITNTLTALVKAARPPAPVSRLRYRFGLAMFTIPLLVGWSAPYLSVLVPALNAHSLLIAAASDLLLLVSIFVLGGDFWEKLHALFVYNNDYVSQPNR